MSEVSPPLHEFATETAPGAPAWAPPSGDLTHGPLQRGLFRLAGPAILAKTLHTLLALWMCFGGRLGAGADGCGHDRYFASWCCFPRPISRRWESWRTSLRNIGAGDRRRAGYATAPA